MKDFWPGGMTLLLPARNGLPGYCVGPGSTVGIRVPNIPELLELIKLAGGSLASTSANLSGEKSPLQISDIPEALLSGTGYVY